MARRFGAGGATFFEGGGRRGEGRAKELILPEKRVLACFQ